MSLRPIPFAFVTAFVATSAGATSFVAAPPDLHATDTLTWDQLGPVGTVVPNPDNVTSTAGRAIVLSQAVGNGHASIAGPGYGPMYAQGERLYYTDNGFGHNAAPLTFVFAQPIDGFGVVCDPDFYLQGFAGTIAAYDTTDTMLGSYPFSVSGDAQYKRVFAGVSSDAPNIHRIVIDGVSAAGLPEDFSVGTVLLRSDFIFADAFDP